MSRLRDGHRVHRQEGIDYKNDIITTTDGDEYGQSGIDHEAADYERRHH